MQSLFARAAYKIVRGTTCYLRKPAESSLLRILTDFVARVAPKGLKPYDVFVFPVIDWDYRFQRPQHLSLEFARRGHRVFYFSTRFAGDFCLREPMVRTVQANVFVIELPGGGGALDIYQDLPNDYEITCLEFGVRAVKEKFDMGATISIVDYPFWAPVVRRLNNNIVLYDCMDDYSSFRNAGPPVRQMESEIVEIADLVVCSSVRLQERLRQRFGRDSVLIRNGVEPKDFSNPPARLAIEPNGRTVGYYGAITDCTDVELIAYAARCLPENRFILVGANDGADLSCLERLPNVSLTDEVPYARLPEYLHAFDVCLLPYRVCEHTVAADPVKLWEYLGAGKPVVAVRLPEIERLKDLITMAEGPDEFVQGIRSSLNETDPQLKARRKAFAAGNSWSRRCDEMQQAIAPFFPKVSVVVLTHNQWKFTKATLDSLERFTGYPNLEVVIVDNGSTDGSPQLLMLWGASRPSYAKIILNQSNLGFPAGNNIGLKAATGEYVVILNNDVYVTEGWAGTLLAHFRANPKLGLLGPVTNRTGNESVVYIGDYSDMRQMATLASRYTRKHAGQQTAMRSLHFFCVMIPRRVWTEVGELDEAFGVGLFEDDDYSVRVRSAGYEVACAEDVFVHHHHSASIGSLPAEAYKEIFARNRRYYESKWGAWVPPVFRKEVQERLNPTGDQASR